MGKGEGWGEGEGQGCGAGEGQGSGAADWTDSLCDCITNCTKSLFECFCCCCSIYDCKDDKWTMDCSAFPCPS